MSIGSPPGIVAPSTADILAIAAKGDGEAMLRWYREQGENPYFFSKVIAGYRELTPDLHQPICRWLVESERVKKRGLLFPRKYFKSSMTKGYLLRRIVKNPEIRILLVGENDEVGAKNIADIQWKIREDKLFQQLYPKIIPEDLGRDWPTSSLTLPRSRSYDEPTIQSVGVGTKHTGFHYDLIVYDDIIGLAASKSKLEMQRALDWFQAANGLLDSSESEELYIGTRWKHGKADLPGWIMEEMPYRESNGRVSGYLWIVRAAIENGRSIFPPQMAQSGKKIGYSLEDLADMKQRMKTYLFNANMMNDPTAGDDTDFKPEWVQQYKIAQDRQAVIIEVKNAKGELVEERVPLAAMVKISILDPSSGGTSAEAENAIVVIGVDSKARIFVLARWSKNCSFGQAVEQWHVINDKWRCGKNFYEAVGAHKEIGEKFKERVDYQNPPQPCSYCGKKHRRIRATPILPPPGHKEDRIRELAQPAFEERRVWIGPNMVGSKEGKPDLEKQIVDFPHGELVDLFDALAYAISKAKKPAVQDPDQAPTSNPQQRGRDRQARTHSLVDHGGYS